MSALPFVSPALAADLHRLAQPLRVLSLLAVIFWASASVTLLTLAAYLAVRIAREMELLAQLREHGLPEREAPGVDYPG